MTMFFLGFISAYALLVILFFAAMMCLEKGIHGTFNIWRKRP